MSTQCLSYAVAQILIVSYSTTCMLKYNVNADVELMMYANKSVLSTPYDVRRTAYDVRRTTYDVRRTAYDVRRTCRSASGALTALSDIVKCRTFCILCFSFVLIDTRMITGSRPLAACRPAMMPSQEFGKTIMPSHDVSQHGEQCTPLL
jgi:hypothetical protein